MDKNVELSNKFNDLINHLIENSEEKELLKKFKDNLCDERLNTIISSFCNTLDSDNKTFKLFLNRNSRIFGNKIHLQLIDDFPIKKYLVNENSYAWECIQLLYAIFRTGDENKKSKVSKVVEAIEKFNLGERNTNTDSNNSPTNCDDLVMDLADTLRNNIVNASKQNADNKLNPMETMFKTAQGISQKYAQQIKSGNISMNDMFSSLGRMMDKIHEKTANDEELKNIEVDKMKDPNDLMKDMGLDLGKLNPMEMVGNLLGSKQNKEKLTEEQIKEMEEFYSQFNSEDIEINKSNDVENNFKQFNEKLMSKIPEDKKNELKNMTDNILSSLNK